MPQSVLEQLAAAGAVTIPQQQLMALERLSTNTLFPLYRAGEVDSVIIGGRVRRVFIASYLAYLRRRQLGIERDEGERRAAAESYERSLTARSAQNAARARRGITAASRQRSSRSRKIAAARDAEQAAARAIAKTPKRTKAATAPPKAGATAKDIVTTA
jgi:hypothetical protein